MEGPRIPFDARRFRWVGVEPKAYKDLDAAKARGMGFAGVSRHTLARPEELPADWELRYFEFEPDGYSSLEKHCHVHFVVVVRGSGRALVGQEVVACRPFDAVYVPALTPHRWMNSGDEPLGFLCTVDRERDGPQPLDDAEWDKLAANPATAPFAF
jgi:S-methyl-1-thioxylulose 5-phosphate methylthiotransferase